MDVGTQPLLKFHGVDFININFHSENPYDNREPIDLNVLPKVFFPEGEPMLFKIVMDVTLVSKGFFELKIIAVGNFELDKELEENLKKTFINTNAPAIMFPYVRSFISTLTANVGGTGHIVVPAQFFKGQLIQIDNRK